MLSVLLWDSWISSSPHHQQKFGLSYIFPSSLSQSDILPLIIYTYIYKVCHFLNLQLFYHEHDMISKVTDCLKSILYFDVIYLKESFSMLWSGVYHACSLIDTVSNLCNIILFSISMTMTQFLIFFYSENVVHHLSRQYFLLFL